MTAVFAVLLAAAAAEPSLPHNSRPRLHVVVVAHVERGVVVDRADLAEIAASVRQTWRPYVDVSVTAADDPRGPVAGDELQLEITNRMLPGDHGQGLGWIEFVNGEPRSTITVSVSAIARLARDGRWRGKPIGAWPPIMARVFLRRALARAVAHEVGHYLLRSRTHAPAGLMRAKLTIDDIMERGRGDRLDPAAVARLRETVPQLALNADGADIGH
jgi:hypothetical protein